MAYDEVKLPSDRSFGLFFSLVFGAFSLYLYIYSFLLAAFLFLSLAVVVFFISILKSDLLHFFNKLWTRFGVLMGKIINPIMLGSIFFFIITPVALAMRLFKRDDLLLRLEKADSYWRDRFPIGPKPESFKDQF